MRIRILSVAAATIMAATTAYAGTPTHSVARQWNDELLEAIRNDFARPTVHARNLYHTSAAMWDAWAAYDDVADQLIHFETATAKNVQAAREETISFAMYRILRARFAKSPGAATSLPSFDALMGTLGYDTEYDSTVGNNPAALGNRIAVSVLFFGLNDNANEQGGYENLVYAPINDPLVPALPGNPDITNQNRWQPLALDFFVDQSGNVIVGGFPDALSPEWGIVTPFAMTTDDLTIHQRDGYDWWTYHDPGDPPFHAGVGDAYYKYGNEMVCVWSSHLDPADGVLIDISPATFGNGSHGGAPDPADWPTYYDFFNGGDWGNGWAENPVTELPYPTQMVPRGDYGRCLAEFWADGPDSETPPGHWNTVLNYVSDHPLVSKQVGGTGPVVDDLEWDIKAYLALNGNMHDCAVAAWGVKGYYDYIRPVSAIRYMCDLGQCSDIGQPSFHPDGINLHPGYIEVVTAASSATGERHAHLAGNEGKIAIKAWRGPDWIFDPATDVAGVDWILAENWWPYQRPSFVTPPFPGYVSGHSTFSRGAAELMTLLTGDPFFPGGVGEFFCPQNEFLVFEDGPSVDITLQWATYRDASDQTSLSRIWGGIHPPADDLPGRVMGDAIGPAAWQLARRHFEGRISCPEDTNADRAVDVTDLVNVIVDWGTDGSNNNGDIDFDGLVDVVDLIDVILRWGSCD